jgi:hypothetical protein
MLVGSGTTLSCWSGEQRTLPGQGGSTEDNGTGTRIESHSGGFDVTAIKVGTTKGGQRTTPKEKNPD